MTRSIQRISKKRFVAVVVLATIGLGQNPANHSSGAVVPVAAATVVAAEAAATTTLGVAVASAATDLAIAAMQPLLVFAVQQALQYGCVELTKSSRRFFEERKAKKAAAAAADGDLKAGTNGGDITEFEGLALPSDAEVKQFVNDKMGGPIDAVAQFVSEVVAIVVNPATKGNRKKQVLATWQAFLATRGASPTPISEESNNLMNKLDDLGVAPTRVEAAITPAVNNTPTSKSGNAPIAATVTGALGLGLGGLFGHLFSKKSPAVPLASSKQSSHPTLPSKEQAD